MQKVLNHIKGDRTIWMVVLFLAISSILLVYSSIVTLAYKHHGGNTLYYLFRHGFFLTVGIGLIYLIHKIKYTYFSRIAQLALYISIPLLLITLIMGANLNNASRWLVIPVINQTFQTSDLAKLSLIMYIARVLSLRQKDIKSFKKAFIPIVLPVLAVCALIFPANLSTAAVLFVCSLILMFIGRISLLQIGGLVGLAAVGLGMVFTLIMVKPDMFSRGQTWKNRVDNFISGKNNSKGNYQAEQAKIAIATGGITGKGPGRSTQRNFLPHPYSDFIYAIVLEEYGLFGGVFIMILYLVLLFRAIKIAQKSPRSFGAFLSIGIVLMLVFQALINMAVAVNLFPVTGQPLPMVSMGGTSIWFTCIAIGIVLSVSRGVEEETKKNTKVSYG